MTFRFVVVFVVCNLRVLLWMPLLRNPRNPGSDYSCYGGRILTTMILISAVLLCIVLFISSCSSSLLFSSIPVAVPASYEEKEELPALSSKVF